MLLIKHACFSHSANITSPNGLVGGIAYMPPNGLVFNSHFAIREYFNNNNL